MHVIVVILRHKMIRAISELYCETLTIKFLTIKIHNLEMGFKPHKVDRPQVAWVQKAFFVFVSRRSLFARKLARPAALSPWPWANRRPPQHFATHLRDGYPASRLSRSCPVRLQSSANQIVGRVVRNRRWGWQGCRVPPTQTKHRFEGENLQYHIVITI